jgi:hypothetical protein
VSSISVASPPPGKPKHHSCKCTYGQPTVFHLDVSENALNAVRRKIMITSGFVARSQAQSAFENDILRSVRIFAQATSCAFGKRR